MACMPCLFRIFSKEEFCLMRFLNGAQEAKKKKRRRGQGFNPRSSFVFNCNSIVFIVDRIESI
jgi:hypothetical protein